MNVNDTYYLLLGYFILLVSLTKTNTHVLFSCPKGSHIQNQHKTSEKGHCYHRHKGKKMICDILPEVWNTMIAHVKFIEEMLFHWPI